MNLEITITGCITALIILTIWYYWEMYKIDRKYDLIFFDIKLERAMSISLECKMRFYCKN